MTALLLAWFALALGVAAQPAPSFPPASSGANAPSARQAQLIQRAGSVEFSPQRQPAWVSATNEQQLSLRDRLRTLALSQAAVQMQDLSVLRLGEYTVLEMLPPRETTARARFSLSQGKAYFLHRNAPRQIEVETPVVRAGIDGTEFDVVVEADGTTLLTLVEGQVTLSNPQGTLALTSGQQGLVRPGQPPIRTASIDIRNVLQWTLYYPGVLDLDELPLTEAERTTLNASIEAYRQGALVRALAAYPTDRLTQARSTAEELFHAALRLSAGRVTNYTEFTTWLNQRAQDPMASALRRLVAAVNVETNFVTWAPTNAGQFVGQSYYAQSRFELRQALEHSRRAVELSPNFGYAWARVAELEFSFGHIRPAEAALKQVLRLSPENAQAHALHGFLLLAREQFLEAEQAFSRAIELDPRLANGWLGRGLGRIQRRQSGPGLADLETAAAMEPTRWLLRSYLARAFQNAADTRAAKSHRARLLQLAESELALAAAQDPLDPTPWLYSALLNERLNRNVDAVRDLERSVELNDNRQLFRSRFLLDEDRAIRSANLARIYDRAGLRELGIQQASRAVEDNYLDSSAHRFLANTYSLQRDPRRVSLREEEAWANQQFLANLLTPVDQGLLSRNVSQLEYSSAFRAPAFGALSLTEYVTTGDFHQTASHFGRVGQLGYALDLDYVNSDGDRGNNDFRRFESFAQFKYDLGSRDAVFVQTKYQDFDGGDLVQYYDPDNERPNFRFSEEQEPLLFAGYQHRWNDGLETLFLAGRLVNDYRYSDQGATGYILSRSNTISPAHEITAAPLYDTRYRNEFEIYSAELNQIYRTERQTLQVGGRVQAGEFRTANSVTNVEDYALGPGGEPFFVYPEPGRQVSDLDRYSIYAYETLNVGHRLRLTAGLSWDHLRYPANFRGVPVSVDEIEEEQLSPKAGVVWTPTSRLVLRGIYSQSLSGASFEDSLRLEPTQIGGFVQSYRNIIPESLAGSLSGASHEVAGLGLDWGFAPASYLGVEARRLAAEATRTRGVYDFYTDLPLPSFEPSSLRERLDYVEQSIQITLGHHLSPELSTVLRYRYTDSELERRIGNVLPDSGVPNDRTDRAGLHQPELWLQYEYPSGLYGRMVARGFYQENESGLADEAIAQIDLFVGWRFWRQQAEITFGLLNVTGENYKLNPLTPYPDLPRERAFLSRFRLNF